jgi:glycosyltransferase involved in cell wall biosynthesis
MRVLYWTHSFWPNIGGVEVLSLEFLPALRARGHEFCIVSADGPEGAPLVGEFAGMPIHRLGLARALARRDAKAMLALGNAVLRIKREFEPDLVHVLYCDPSVLFHMNTAVKHPAPSLLTIYAFLESVSDGASLQSQALRSADWVVAPSTAILDAARRQVPEIALRSGVLHPSTSEAPAAEQPPLCFDPPRLACVGRLARDKGFDLAVRALAEVIRRYPSARLCLAGDGPERASLAALATRLGVAHAVDFPGWSDRSAQLARVFDLISNSTIIVVPSRWMEPFGLAALHAAQCGRPVVASRTGGLLDIVEDGVTGLLVEREDAAGLASAICALLSGPDRTREMGLAARRRAAGRFAWEPFVVAHDTLYRRLGERRLPTAGRA